LRVATIAKVDDSAAFVRETMSLLLETHQAMQKYDNCKTEIKTEQKQVADRRTWIITMRIPNKDAKGDKDFTEETLLLSEIDPGTVLAAHMAKADQAESMVKMFSQAPKTALSANPGLKDTAALLPKELQVSVYINMSAVMNAKRETPPLAFALRTLPAGAEAQFVVPFGALQAMFDAVNAEKKGKQK